ncbi:MAG: 4-hydroxy-3-methylbut-2-enyl diphosphate reductase [Pseudomonadota bacterium]|nr:4-hydroxy-3-methylbut-2-enyl diphosphate reductase [Pseudomonadota bacterium]
MEVLLAEPRGFCAGVVRAIEIVEQALEQFGAPVYVRHEIVHNRHVVSALEQQGARFVDEVEQIPDGAVTVFSAHGVARDVERAAARRALPVLDATCPMVSKVHVQARRFVAQGRALVLIGHAGHPEVVGTMGQVEAPIHLVGCAADVARLPIGPTTPLAYVTQTTLSVEDTRTTIEALKARFSDLAGPETDNICYATQNRQAVLREIAPRVDVILVVGDANSSNSNRLREIGAECGVPSYLLADGDGLDRRWLEGARAVGLTAGASAPEAQVQSVLRALQAIAPIRVRTVQGVRESAEFRLPAALLGDAGAVRAA